MFDGIELPEYLLEATNAIEATNVNKATDMQVTLIASETKENKKAPTPAVPDDPAAVEFVEKLRQETEDLKSNNERVIAMLKKEHAREQEKLNKEIADIKKQTEMILVLLQQFLPGTEANAQLKQVNGEQMALMALLEISKKNDEAKIDKEMAELKRENERLLEEIKREKAANEIARQEKVQKQTSRPLLEPNLQLQATEANVEEVKRDKAATNELAQLEKIKKKRKNKIEAELVDLKEPNQTLRGPNLQLKATETIEGKVEAAEESKTAETADALHESVLLQMPIDDSYFDEIDSVNQKSDAEATAEQKQIKMKRQQRKDQRKPKFTKEMRRLKAESAAAKALDSSNVKKRKRKPKISAEAQSLKYAEMEVLLVPKIQKTSVKGEDMAEKLKREQELENAQREAEERLKQQNLIKAEKAKQRKKVEAEKEIEDR